MAILNADLRYDPEFNEWDAGLLCWNEEQFEYDSNNWPGFWPDIPICYDYDVRFCCEDEVVEPRVV